MDTPQATPSGNGEKIQFSLGSRSIGIQAGSLIPILLLLGLFVGGYLLWVAQDHRMADQTQAIVQQMHTFTTALQDQQAFIVSKVMESRNRQDAQAKESRERHEQEMQDFLRLLTTHEYNMWQEPQNRLPLLLPAPGP